MMDFRNLVITFVIATVYIVAESATSVYFSSKSDVYSLCSSPGLTEQTYLFPFFLNGTQLFAHNYLSCCIIYKINIHHRATRNGDKKSFKEKNEHFIA